MQHWAESNLVDISKDNWSRSISSKSAKLPSREKFPERRVHTQQPAIRSKAVLVYGSRLLRYGAFPGKGWKHPFRGKSIVPGIGSNHGFWDFSLGLSLGICYDPCPGDTQGWRYGLHLTSGGSHVFRSWHITVGVQADRALAQCRIADRFASKESSTLLCTCQSAQFRPLLCPISCLELPHKSLCIPQLASGQLGEKWSRLMIPTKKRVSVQPAIAHPQRSQNSWLLHDRVL